MSESELPFQGKKKRIAERLLRAEDRKTIVREEDTTPNYVNNTVSEMHKLNILIPKPEQKNIPTLAATDKVETLPVLDGGNEGVRAPPLEAAAPLDPETKDLQDQDDAIVAGNTGKAQRLKLLQQISQHSKQSERLDENVRQEERRRQVKTMPYDFQDFANGMRTSLRDHSVLRDRLDNVFRKLGRGDDFESNINHVLRQYFERINPVISTLREEANSVGGRAPYFPTLTSFPEDQWNLILQELEDDARSESFGQHLARLDQLLKTPAPVCPYDKSNLEHTGGGSLKCAKGHRFALRCPSCGGALTVDGRRLHCPACHQRFFDQ